MQMTVTNRFAVLLKEKEKKEKRTISLLQVSRETGIPYKTIYAWAANAITRFDAVMLERLAEYFDVSALDMLQED